jgi:protein-tyrosine phosphatase
MSLIKELLLTPFSSFNKIEDNLYLGNYKAVNDYNFLNRHNIKAIVSLYYNPDFHIYKNKKYYHLSIRDDKKFISNKKMFIEFDKIIKFIYENQQNGGVLIHCHFGYQRSATVTAAYIMWKYNMSMKHAINHIKSKRNLVFLPDIHFRFALTLWEKKLIKQINK